jgi:hypothetical protein
MNRGAPVGAILFGFILVIAVCFGGAALLGGTPTTTGPIDMVQPNGYPQRNLTESQANLNNSQANLNNANAAAVPTLTAAEYELKMAQACQFRGDCVLTSIQTYNTQHPWWTQIPWYAWLVIIAVGAFILFGLFGGGGQQPPGRSHYG